jgi:hypothetical protein
VVLKMLMMMSYGTKSISRVKTNKNLDGIRKSFSVVAIVLVVSSYCRCCCRCCCYYCSVAIAVVVNRHHFIKKAACVTHFQLYPGFRVTSISLFISLSSQIQNSLTTFITILSDPLVATQGLYSRHVGRNLST